MPLQSICKQRSLKKQVQTENDQKNIDRSSDEAKNTSKQIDTSLKIQDCIQKAYQKVGNYLSDNFASVDIYVVQIMLRLLKLKQIWFRGRHISSKSQEIQSYGEECQEESSIKSAWSSEEWMVEQPKLKNEYQALYYSRCKQAVLVIQDEIYNLYNCLCCQMLFDREFEDKLMEIKAVLALVRRSCRKAEWKFVLHESALRSTLGDKKYFEVVGLVEQDYILYYTAQYPNNLKKQQLQIKSGTQKQLLSKPATSKQHLQIKGESKNCQKSGNLVCKPSNIQNSHLPTNNQATEPNLKDKNEEKRCAQLSGRPKLHQKQKHESFGKSQGKFRQLGGSIKTRQMQIGKKYIIGNNLLVQNMPQKHTEVRKSKNEAKICKINQKNFVLNIEEKSCQYQVHEKQEGKQIHLFEQAIKEIQALDGLQKKTDQILQNNPQKFLSKGHKEQAANEQKNQSANKQVREDLKTHQIPGEDSILQKFKQYNSGNLRFSASNNLFSKKYKAKGTKRKVKYVYVEDDSNSFIQKPQSTDLSPQISSINSRANPVIPPSKQNNFPNKADNLHSNQQHFPSDINPLSQSSKDLKSKKTFNQDPNMEKNQRKIPFPNQPRRRYRGVGMSIEEIKEALIQELPPT